MGGNLYLIKRQRPALWRICYDMSQPTKAIFWPHMFFNLVVGMHWANIFRFRICKPLCASNLQPAMVDISYRCQIKYQEEKPITIPADLVEEHQDQKFLKFSATNYAICQLVCGGKLPKNPSLSQSRELQASIQARNEKVQEHLATPEDTQEGQELFDADKSASNVAKKRKAQTMEGGMENFVVTLQLGTTEIPCLVGGQRPSKSDLFVLMEPEPLKEAIGHLRAGCQMAFAQPTRGYRVTKKD